MKPKGRVFLVDDEQLIVSMLTRALRNEGHEVFAETSTDGVIDKITAVSPDLLILDINMPGQNGLDILKAVRKNELPTQVMMLTANDTAETAAEAMSLGADDYLTKPFDLDTIKAAVRDALERKSHKQRSL
ncbi:MAG: response regulator [Chloroflexota bacterium]